MLQDHHDALRMVFREEEGKMIQVNLGSEMKVDAQEWDLRKDPDADAALSATAGGIQAGIDLSNGPLMRLGLFHKNDGNRGSDRHPSPGGRWDLLAHSF